jgi:hypothetical protein
MVSERDNSLRSAALGALEEVYAWEGAEGEPVWMDWVVGRRCCVCACRMKNLKTEWYWQGIMMLGKLYLAIS